MKWEVKRYLPLRDSHKLHRSTKGETWELKSESYVAFWNIYRCWSDLLSRWVWNQKTEEKKKFIRLQKNPSIIRNPNWGKRKIMKNKPLNHGSRRHQYVSKLHAQLRRPLWRWALVCGVVEVWASKDGRGRKLHLRAVGFLNLFFVWP